MTRPPRPARRGSPERSLENVTAETLYGLHRKANPRLPPWESLTWDMHAILSTEARLSIQAALTGLMTELYRDMMGQPTDDQSTVMMYLIGVKTRLESPPKRFVDFTEEPPTPDSN